MPTIMLSDTALSLLRLNITGPYVAATAENREASPLKVATRILGAHNLISSR